MLGQNGRKGGGTWKEKNSTSFFCCHDDKRDNSPFCNLIAETCLRMPVTSAAESFGAELRASTSVAWQGGTKARESSGDGAREEGGRSSRGCLPPERLST